MIVKEKRQIQKIEIKTFLLKTSKMCIIPGPIQSVTNTKIFVLPNQDKTRQLTFYMNSVETPDDNMMILPVPNIQSLQLHTVKYKALFKDLGNSVYRIPERPYMPYYGENMLRCASVIEPLEVISHGSYLVSIAPTLEDLFRLDMSVFEFSQELYDFFAKHYTREFGYLCCKLKEGSQEYEPISYSHNIHSSGKLFVPTLHYHNHYGKIDTQNADWDHLIYSAGTLKEANLKFISNSENKVRWKKLPEGFQYAESAPIRCAELTGNQHNRDIAFVVA
jgi:hypothetical protein